MSMPTRETDIARHNVAEIALEGTGGEQEDHAESYDDAGGSQFGNATDERRCRQGEDQGASERSGQPLLFDSELDRLDRTVGSIGPCLTS
jgi:hypothetical protein